MQKDVPIMDSTDINRVSNDNKMTPEKRLEQLKDWKCNKLCADCEEPYPAWASVNRGVFICTQCAGVHRSLGVDVSFVLSCSLDDWTHEQVDNMEGLGNERVNKNLEFCVPKITEAPYGKDAERKTREDFIKAKYVEELFARVEGRNEMPARRIRPQEGHNECTGSVGMVEFIGIVNVKLISCRNMVIKDVFSSDPYCKLFLGLQVHKSSIKYNTLNPDYNENFSFSWNGQDKLKIEYYDKDNFSADDHMGVTEVNLSILNRQQEITQWYSIQHRNHPERLQGEVKLELSFTAIN